MSAIDVEFDFQKEAGLDRAGVQRDSDKYSPTLQEYHRILWSKPLPSGKMFELTKISDNRLYHRSELGEFYLSSDRAIATFSSWVKMKHVIEQIPAKELKDFIRLTDTIGGIVIWPSNKINGSQTINAARGFNRQIVDRLDLTIECIRRFYLGETSPLYETFLRYNDFFQLFDDFKGYVDFFLLQDYVTEDYTSVKIAEPFDDFRSTPIPKTVDEYLSYMNMTSELIKLRNQRIKNNSTQVKQLS